jgi:hypothetical protein
MTASEPYVIFDPEHPPESGNRGPNYFKLLDAEALKIFPNSVAVAWHQFSEARHYCQDSFGVDGIVDTDGNEKFYQVNPVADWTYVDNIFYFKDHDDKLAFEIAVGIDVD